MLHCRAPSCGRRIFISATEYAGKNLRPDRSKLQDSSIAYQNWFKQLEQSDGNL